MSDKTIAEMIVWLRASAEESDTPDVGQYLCNVLTRQQEQIDAMQAWAQRDNWHGYGPTDTPALDTYEAGTLARKAYNEGVRDGRALALRRVQEEQATRHLRPLCNHCAGPTACQVEIAWIQQAERERLARMFEAPSPGWDEALRGQVAERLRKSTP